MAKPSASACPWCGAEPGCLFVVVRLVAAPVGSFSLSGYQMKAPARYRPCLVCRSCRKLLAGEWADERHPVFDSSGSPETLTEEQVRSAAEAALPE